MQAHAHAHAVEGLPSDGSCVCILVVTHLCGVPVTHTQWLLLREMSLWPQGAQGWGLVLWRAAHLAAAVQGQGLMTVPCRC
jgi:hypothetical protein